jgi:hypothetical protein
VAIILIKNVTQQYKTFLLFLDKPNGFEKKNPFIGAVYLMVFCYILPNQLLAAAGKLYY